MATLEDALRLRGATDQMLASKTFQMAQDAIADGAVDGLDEARVVANKIEQATKRADRMLGALSDTSKQSENLLLIMDDAMRTLEPMAAKVTLTDRKTIDAVNAYTLVLQRTKEVLGDNLGDEVLIKTIEAASYCAWRTIMGPKAPDGHQRI